MAGGLGADSGTFSVEGLCEGNSANVEILAEDLFEY